MNSWLPGRSAARSGALQTRDRYKLGVWEGPGTAVHRFALHRIRETMVLLCTCFVALAPADARAQSVADFYRGKQITLVTSASVGGGYDQYARLLAKHMPRHIPGNPAIIVENMVGAEGVRAANYVYRVAAQDGTVIGGLSRNTGLARFYDFDKAGIQFDARKFHWLGSPEQEVGLFILSTKTGLHTIDDLKTRAVTVSSTAANSPTTIYSRMLNATLGTKLKPVTGYAGSQACLLALERGEVDAHISGGSSAPFRATMMPWLQKGEARIIMVMGMKRDAAFPDVPTAIEIERNAADKQLFEIAFAEQVMGRPFVLPPGMSPDRVVALRAAFDATMQDPDFLADAKAQNAHIDPVGGEAINALLDRVYLAPSDVVARIRQLIK
jgi:tripartite-type tricarboxylate transporter receptor subunit TctC